jgi:predicted transcriptional regulator
MNDSAQKDIQNSPSSNGWEQHELEQLQRLAKLSISEKLEWLEQAQRIAENLRRPGEDRPAPKD